MMGPSGFRDVRFRGVKRTCAQLHGLPVVTYETLAKQNAAPKIPNVCAARGIECVDVVEVLRKEGFKL